MHGKDDREKTQAHTLESLDYLGACLESCV